MTDEKRAKEILSDEGLTLALVKGELVYRSTLRGVSPMVKFLTEGICLRGFFAADKVVGKAAAMLFILAGVNGVYSDVMTREAEKVLVKYGISAFYGTLADKIINRTGDDICPMEKAVIGIEEPSEAFKAIVSTLEKLKK